MFPVGIKDKSLKPKDYVFALRDGSVEKAWPLTYFGKNPVINDTAGVVSLTLVGDPKTRSVRAYRTDGTAFGPGKDATTLTDPQGQTWTVSETALTAPDGKQHTRLPGHIAYWFAWTNYFGKDGEIASPPSN